MEALTVRTHDGLICIEQVELEEDSGVVFYPDQLPMLIGWLQEAAIEIRASETLRAAEPD